MMAGVVASYGPVSRLLSWNTGVAGSSLRTFSTSLVTWLGRLQATQAFLFHLFIPILAKIWIYMNCVAFICLTFLDTFPTLFLTASISTGSVRWTAPTLLLRLVRGSAELLIVDALLVINGHIGRVSTVPTFA